MSNAQARRSRLELQGFACDADTRILAAARWLRFTPTLSTLSILAGTALQSPLVLWTFALIATLGAAGWHPFDALFNVLVRRLVHAPSLPPNPPPRRFAMAVAAIWSAGAAWLMSAGWIWTGILAGSALALAGAIVATTHFCLGSWMFHMFWRRA